MKSGTGPALKHFSTMAESIHQMMVLEIVLLEKKKNQGKNQT